MVISLVGCFVGLLVGVFVWCVRMFNCLFVCCLVGLFFRLSVLLVCVCLVCSYCLFVRWLVNPLVRSFVDWVMCLFGSFVCLKDYFLFAAWSII